LPEHLCSAPAGLVPGQLEQCRVLRSGEESSGAEAAEQHRS
jgi:hypothetical protein